MTAYSGGGLSLEGIIDMDELSRFKEKAASYRKALEEEPNARLLELYPIIWYLERYRTGLGKRKESIKIVDLMAGSGFLSENLYKLGYTNIDAVEFCTEMSKDASAYFDKARLRNITSFDHLEGVLDGIKPDVIISLASFHHLLVYDNTDTVDKLRSINLQTDVVDMCMRSLPEEGILMIADLIDEGVAETSLEPFKAPMSSIANDLKQLGVDGQIVELLSKNSSLHGASSNLHRTLGVSGNGKSLRWFREIVDKKTAVGHKDIAISQDFLQKVANYRPIITKYVCPWIFASRTKLLKFVYKKFGFGIDHASGIPVLSESEVEMLVDEKLGIRNVLNHSTLGWSLGIVLLGKHEPFAKVRKLTTYAWYLLAMVVVLLIALGLRLLADVYVEMDVQAIFFFLLSLPIGAIFGDWFASRNDK